MTENEKYIGVRYGKIVINEVFKPANSRYRARYTCDCGKVKDSRLSYIINKPINSCGCFHKHGMTHSSEYKIWLKIKDRCFNGKCKEYPWYGERGIVMQDSWAGDFMKFYSHIGDRPSQKHQVDRINTNKGYEEGNVRWVTGIENARNTRLSKRWVIDGITYLSASHAADMIGVSKKCITNWCKGYVSKGKKYPKKDGCHAYDLYKDKGLLIES